MPRAKLKPCPFCGGKPERWQAANFPYSILESHMAIDRYGTHLPLLLACATRTRPYPLLELGVGWHSTLPLHALTGPKQTLVSVDGNKAWLERFSADFTSPQHTFRLAPFPLSAPDLFDIPWGTVLVDNATEERRVWIEALASKCIYMVVHDTQAKSYGYSEVWKLFDNIYHWKAEALRWGKALCPWTSVCSNRAPVDWLEEMFPNKTEVRSLT